MKKLIVIIPFFGRAPAWISFFLASCSKNPDVDFLLISDFKINHKPNNVIHIETSFEKYREIISVRLGIRTRWSNPYKLCDLKPALGLIHDDITKNYQYFGYCDIDLVFGEILEKYYPLLKSYDVISSHTFLMAGHFAVYKNRPETLNLFRKISNWRAFFSFERYVHFDEKIMSTIVMPEVDRKKLTFAQEYKSRIFIDGCELKCLFKEQYTTFMGDWLLPNGEMTRPRKWTWDNGVVTNDVMRDSILYAHFSLWNSGQWGNPEDPEKGAWKIIEKIAQEDIPYDNISKFSITREGFSLE